MLKFGTDLFKPRSVTVIGASESRNTFQGKAIRYILKHNFPGEVYPVNPKYEQVFGHKCYPSINDVPGEIDAAIVVIRSDLVPRVLRDCARKSCKLAIVISAAFSEAGEEGKKRQQELKDLIKETSMRIAGPNCVGMINFVDGIALGTSTFLERSELLKGEIGFVSQSGAMIGSVIDQAHDHGFGFSYAFSTGNEVDLDLADYIDLLVDDPNTKVITAYIEGIRNYDKFFAAVERAHQNHKPIFACKIGRSSQAVAAAATHTGVLAGSDKVIDAMFKQIGVVRVHDVDDLFTAASLFLKTGNLKTNGVGIFSVSGGAAGLMADGCSEYGMEVPNVSMETENRIKEITGITAPYNPIDVLRVPISDLQNVTKALKAFIEDDNFGIIIVAMTMIYFLDESAELIINAVKQTNKPVVVYWTAGSTTQKQIQAIQDAGIPLYRTSTECLRSIKAVLKYSEYTRQLSSESVSFETGLKVEKSSRCLAEYEAKKLLSNYGISTTMEEIAHDSTEAIKLAQSIGYPVALKISSGDIPHKTEAGGIILGVSSDQEVEEAYERILDNVQKYKPEAVIEGVLVQEMAPPGAEVILGVSSEPGIGPVILFGLGGIFVEVFKDVTLRVAQFMDRETAEEMVKEIKGYSILKGARGRRPCDTDAIVETIVKLARFAMAYRDSIDQIDINPLRVFEQGKGVKVVDALIMLRENVTRGNTNLTQKGVSSVQSESVL